jgi:predicted acetyltransferase
VKVEVVRATAGEASVLDNLMQLYLYEWSDISAQEIGEDGRFAYRYLPQYWTDSGRYPFLIQVDGHLAGFALIVKRDLIEPGCLGHAVAEFFVLRAYRRKGVGEQAARTLFEMFPGHWWVGELVQNTAAQAFWRRVIGSYTAGNFDERTESDRGEQAVVQTFDNSSLAGVPKLFDREAWKEHEKALARFHDWEAAQVRAGDDDLSAHWAWYQEIWKLARETGTIDSQHTIDTKRIRRLQELESRLAQVLCPS